ncbi:MAG: amidohydrolase family protein [Methanomicrobiales archaeon]|nr:amidohydrolase family protein [Methanomicrobiales archaeon]
MIVGDEGDYVVRAGSVLLRQVSIGGRIVDIAIGDDGTIAAIGEGIGAEYKGDAEFIVEGKQDIAIPGLVNTHTHAAMALFRGYADDLPLHEWLTSKIWPLEALLTGDDVYHGTRLACLEMIRSGTVAFNDMYFFMKDAARAVTEMGMKAVLAYGFIDLFDEERREREIRATEEFCRWIGSLRNPSIRAAVGPHAVYTVSTEAMKWLADFAKREGIIVHVHLSETEREVAECEKMYGRRPAFVLDECGLLTERTTAAHCCWLDQQECNLLGKRGVHVSYNPVSNMKLAVGRAIPYQWLKEAGANVTLGTDGAASNNNLDLMEGMKFAALLQKFFWNSQTILPAHDTLAMATSSGARALGFGDGRLMAGSPADIVLVDRYAVCNTPLHHLESNLVYSCTGGSVKTLICSGKVLMQDRVVFDERKIIEDAAKAAQRLLDRLGEQVIQEH